MRRTLFALSLSALLATAALAGDDKEKPKPPDTPLPKFENPLFDAKVGETLRYQVKDYPDGRWTRYYEERVLARTKDKVLVETVETNPAGDKIWSVLGPKTGWRPLTEAIQIPDGSSWKKERQKEEILYVGTPPTKAIRCTHRVLDESSIPGEPDSPRRVRELWYSHDVPVTGRAKEYPALENGERMVISWDKVLPDTECADRAKKYPDIPQPPANATPTAPEGGMDGGMDGGGMDEPPMDGGGMGG